MNIFDDNLLKRYTWMDKCEQTETQLFFFFFFCPLIHHSNWELLAQKLPTSRPLAQLCPLSLMSLNDFNILLCHILANTSQFSIPTRPIAWPRFDPRVMMMYSLTFQSITGISLEGEREQTFTGICCATFGNESWQWCSVITDDRGERSGSQCLT